MEKVKKIWENVKKLSGTIRNLSVRKTIILYMFISLVLCFFLSAWIIRRAELIQNTVWWKYADQEAYNELVKQGRGGYIFEPTIRPDSLDMTPEDLRVSEFCDFAETWTALILSSAGSLGAVFLFYRHKLKAPIRELATASGRIGENDLDFRITYENRDEMGELCKEFERMREQLVKNNRKLWNALEEERILRAAIAHDIRSPLSVLEGYQEMLMEFLPDGTIDKEEAVEMLWESKKQIERMDVFVDTMQKLSSLEHREMLVSEITGKQLEKELWAEVDILGKDSEIDIVLEVSGIKECFFGDKEVILEVTENLLSNALQYGKERVEIKVSVTSEELEICVRDDGIGFMQNIREVTKVFYKQNVKDSLKHEGMGMYISRLYCEKHGGKLLLENEKSGGAVVKALFRRIAS